jgi:acetylornithine deacetylase
MRRWVKTTNQEGTKVALCLGGNLIPHEEDSKVNAIAQKVLDHVDEGAIVDLASELIRIPSFKTEETAVARWLADYFSVRGYQVDLQEVEPGRFQTVATMKGTGGGKSLMFNGHIDIDPIALGWKCDPWTPRVEGDRLYGAGIYNMKGGVTSMIMAAEAIRESGVELKGDLVMACVAGELQGGVGTVHLLESGVRTDMAVVTEPYGADNVITTHAGVTELAISTLGYSQHISRMEEAVDAIEKMYKAIEALKQVKFRYTPRADLPGLPRLNVGCIIGGRGRDYDLKGPNYTCDYCTVLVDVRFLPSQTSQTVLEDIHSALDALKADDPDFEYEIEMPPPPRFKALQVIMEPTDVPLDEYIVQSVIRSYKEVTGKDPKTVGTILPLSYGGDDTCHLWRAGIPCLLYGPEGVEETREESDNFIFISEMVRATKVLALTALDVCNLDA